MHYDNKRYTRNFGKNLQKLRGERNLSLSELSDKIWETNKTWVDRNSIYRIEKGLVNCTILTVKLLANGLGLQPSELFQFDERAR